MKRWLPSTLIPLMAGAVLAQNSTPVPPPAVPATPPPISEPAAPVIGTPAPAPETNAPAKPKAAKKKANAKKKSTAQKAKAVSKPAAKPETTVLAEPTPAVVKKDNVNLRGRPSFVGEVITKLHKGDSVTILEEITMGTPGKDEPSKWAKIALPPKIPVWISAEFVDPATKTITPKKLNFRAGPGENYSVLGRVTKGTVVTELEKKKGWLQIEAPTNAYAFIAADYLDKQAPSLEKTPAPQPVASATPTPAPVAPTPPTQVVNVPTETNVVAAAKPEPQPAPPAPAPAQPTAPAPEVQTPPAPQPTPAAVASAQPEEQVDAMPPEDEPLPKRIVTHEGVVRAAINIQAPADFELHDGTTGLLLDYITSESPDVKLKSFLGLKVMVTGEELLDKRWPRTPILEVETIETP